MGNLNDAQKSPADKAKRLDVPIVESQPVPTGVCANCGKTLYNNQPCNCQSKKDWL